MTAETLRALAGRIGSVKRDLEKSASERDVHLSRLKEVQDEIVELSASVVHHERAVALLNSLGEERQLRAQDAIEQLVTRGLQTIFEESLSFHILQDVKARRAEVTFIVRSELPNGVVIDTDVMNARGGGLAAIVGFLLRLVVMLLKTDTNQDNFLVLDETFAHVSDEYLPPLREFLRQIVDKTGVQILMVTHQPEFVEAADKVYRLSTSASGRSVVAQEV